MELSPNAYKVFQLKYSKNKTKTWKDTCQRVAKYVASIEKNFGATEEEILAQEEKYFNIIYNLELLPGGRILANSDSGIKSLANCFILDIDDSRKSIYKTLADAAEVFAWGGGCGYNFSKIREEGAEIKTTGGKASGALSFLSLFDQTGEVIQQASRRGAQLCALNIDHPDIEKYINFKSKLNHRNSRLVEEYKKNLNGDYVDYKISILEKTLLDDQLTHFNISVVITDKFMQACENNEDWELVSPATGEVIKKVSARKLLYEIANQAWRSGDPGCLFFDSTNKDNMVDYLGKIEATNPCGEIPMLPGESCNLASINLFSIYNKKTKELDWEKLQDIVRIGVRFLDDVVEISEAPVDYINYWTKGLRRIGLGVLGWADLLSEMEIPYDSYEAVALASMLSKFITLTAWEESHKLAKERGAFPFYEKDKANLNAFTKVTSVSKEELDAIREAGFRNVSVTTIPPTGSVSILAGVNSGIEPFFALAYKRNITEGVGNIAVDTIIEINPALFNKLKQYNFTEEQVEEVKNHLLKTGSVRGCDIVPEDLQAVFPTANEIDWIWHIKHQTAWQSGISNAISKTINCPEDTTVDEVYEMYIMAWKMGSKGLTIYRDNSRTFQILERSKNE